MEGAQKRGTVQAVEEAQRGVAVNDKGIGEAAARGRCLAAGPSKAANAGTVVRSLEIEARAVVETGVVGSLALVDIDIAKVALPANGAGREGKGGGKAGVENIVITGLDDEKERTRPRAKICRAL